MRRKILIGLLLVISLIVITGCNKEEKEKSSKKDVVTKIETVKEGKNEKANIILDGNNHSLIINEVEDNKVKVLFDNQDFLSFKRKYYDAESTSDMFVYKTIKGEDDKHYFVFAMSNFYISSFQQYLYIFNNEGKIIFHEDDDKFGAAFTDYEHMESFEDIYGDTGKYQVQDDKIIYLEYFNYTPPEEFLRYREMIMTINNDEIKTKQGDIIKVAIVS